MACTSPENSNIEPAYVLDFNEGKLTYIPDYKRLCNDIHLKNFGDVISAVYCSKFKRLFKNLMLYSRTTDCCRNPTIIIAFDNEQLENIRIVLNDYLTENWFCAQISTSLLCVSYLMRQAFCSKRMLRRESKKKDARCILLTSHPLCVDCLHHLRTAVNDISVDVQPLQSLTS